MIGLAPWWVPTLLLPVLVAFAATVGALAGRITLAPHPEVNEDEA